MSKIPPHTLINLARGDFTRPLYRIFSFERLLELIETKRNALVHPSLWDDPFENFILNSTFKMDDGTPFTLGFRDHVFGQCWTVLPESDAMWRIYSPTKDGVRIRTTMKKLLLGLRDSQNEFQDISCFIGKVSYHAERQLESLFFSPLDASGHNQARSLLLKRRAFNHEHEARLIYLMPNTQETPERVFRYTFDPSIIEEITFDPRMSERMFQVYHHYLSSLGMPATVNQSTLYRPPRKIIRNEV